MRVSRELPPIRDVLRAGEAFESVRASFESEYASACDGGSAALFPSGRDALAAILEALARPGARRVVLPAFLDASLVETADRLGLEVIGCDVRRSDGTLDPDALARVIAEDVAAVVVIHMAGRPAPLERIHAVCATRRIPVVEDCAHAPIPPFASQHGAWSAASFTSFASFKLVDCGGGGGAHTFDPVLAKTLMEASRRYAPVGRFTSWARGVSAAATRAMSTSQLYSAVGHPLFRALTRGEGVMPFYKRYVRPFLKRGADDAVRPLPSAPFLAAGIAQWRSLPDRLAVRRTRTADLLAGLPESVLLRATPLASSAEYAQIAVVRDRPASLEKLAAAGVDALPSPMMFYGEADRAPVAAHLAAQSIQLPWFDEMTPDELERIRIALRAIEPA